MKTTLTLLALAMLALSGCRQMRANSVLKEYEKLLNPKVGKAGKAEIIQTLGVPQRCEPAGTSEFCTFRTSYGMTSNATAYGTGSTATSYAHAWEMYDQIDVSFDANGKLATWKAHVQR